MQDQILKTILIVEDEIILAMGVQHFLEVEGFRTLLALDGEQAVECVTDPHRTVDLILMDVNLGRGMDGTQAARRILAEREIPIIFLSSHTEKEIVEKTEAISSYGYVVKNSGGTVLLASIKMAFKLHQANQSLRLAEQKIRHSENQLQAVLKIGQIGYLDWDLAANHMQWSDETYHILGIESSAVIPSLGAVLQLVHHQDNQIVREKFESAAAGKGDINLKFRLRRPSGGEAFIHVRAELQRDNQGKPIRLLGTLHDISDQKRVEDALRLSEDYMRAMIDCTPEPLFSIDTEGKVVTWNPAASRVLGWKPEEVIGKRTPVVPPDKEDEFAAIIQRVRAGEAISGLEIVRQKKDGSRFIASLSTAAIRDADNQVIGTMAAMRDITEKKQAEQQIIQLLHEKELLIHEIHHRVKNNISAISSMLQLQLEKQADSAARSALQDAISHLQGMMVLYDKLLRSENTGALSLKVYLPALVEEITNLFDHKGKIDKEIHVDDIIVDQNLIPPLGIILNELITNSMKHAFPGQEKGKIRLTAFRQNNTVSIIFEDNGIGMPEAVDIGQSSGFGMQLISMLVEQIKGEIQVRRQPGTQFSIQFPARPL